MRGKLVKCNKCKHLIERSDAQKINIFINDFDGHVSDPEFYCPLHKINVSFGVKERGPWGLFNDVVYYRSYIKKVEV